jgi:hypothetical protein
VYVMYTYRHFGENLCLLEDESYNYDNLVFIIFLFVAEF